jgi:hypothetical protein
MTSVDSRKMGLQSPGYSGESFSLSGRTQVSSSVFSRRTVNRVYFGQSQGNNSITGGPASPTHASHIFNTSIGHKGAIFQGIEPLLASDLTDGHRQASIQHVLPWRRPALRRRMRGISRQSSR